MKLTLKCLRMTGKDPSDMNDDGVIRTFNDRFVRLVVMQDHYLVVSTDDGEFYMAHLSDTAFTVLGIKRSNLQSYQSWASES